MSTIKCPTCGRGYYAYSSAIKCCEDSRLEHDIRQLAERAERETSKGRT